MTCVQASVWKLRSRSVVNNHPDLQSGYTRLIRGWLLWGNLPWLVLGIGSVVGGMSIRDLPRLRTSNPFVLAFYASVLVVWVLAARWLYFRGGAAMLVEHPGLVRASSPLGVKL